MSEKTLNNIRIINKHDTETNWLKATGFIPKQGELIVYDIDETHLYERIKIGDGVQNVNDLPFATDLMFVINVKNSGGKSVSTSYIADKTFDEILTAYNNKKNVYCYCNYLIIPLVYINENYGAIFEIVDSDVMVTHYSVTIANDDSVTVKTSYLQLDEDSNLQTEDKTIVGAINEVKIKSDSVDNAVMYHINQNLSETYKNIARTNIGAAKAEDVDNLSALVGDTSVSDQISNAIAEIPEQVQVDWSQNDSTKADYIKNRPFYVGDIIEQPVIESQTVEGFSYGYVEDAVEFVLVDGENYVVMWDGIRYECTASIASRDVCIGNLNLWDSSQASNDMPFAMVFEDGGSIGSNVYYLLSANTTATSHTIALSIVAPEIVKIDEKYLPDVVAERGSHITSVVLSDFNATASAPYAFVSGPACQATGSASHAEGRRTVASGNDSHSEGYETIASGENQHVEGKYNIEDTASTYVHIVGNGSSLARSNAYTLDWSGNAWFAGDVYVGGTNQASGEKLIKLSDIPVVDNYKNGLMTSTDKKKLDTVESNAQKNVQSDWALNDMTSMSFVKNRPFYDGPLSITWDGVTKGHASHMYDSSNYLVKITDKIFTDEELQTAKFVISENGTTTEVVVADVWENRASTNALTGILYNSRPCVYVVRQAGTFVGPGTYFLYNYSSKIYIQSLTVGSDADIKKIDEKYIPDTIARTPKLANVTLSAANWTGSANPWSQVVTINGVTANSKIDLQPTAVQIVELQNAEITLMLQNDTGVVTAWAIGNKPTQDYEMQVLISEVIRL